MLNDSIYRILVPNAPLHRRTEEDVNTGVTFSLRSKLNRLMLSRKILPGLQEPSLISSFEGAIDQLLFSFHKDGANNPKLASGYKSVINALRVGTKFIVVHHESIKTKVESWFTNAGHELENVLLISVPDYVNMTDWAEDGYVSLKDSADGSGYLMEPWEFPRGGDALVADAVEEFSEIKASQAPLIFQGGNCLIGNNFWFLGRDYFLDTINLLQGSRPPVEVPDGENIENFATELFSKYVDKNRTLYLIGTERPIPIREIIGTKDKNEYYLEIAADGVGTFQPIFHIDMFITLIGENDQGNFDVMVGSPALADEVLGTTSPFALDNVYDSISKSITDLGFSVKRNPLVHRPQIVNSLLFSQLKQIAHNSNDTVLINALTELTTFGAIDETIVKIRTWHHVTWNNCLVENSSTKGKNVYLPTFGHNENLDLKVIDDEMKTIWENCGFTVHLLGDFNEFARRQGVVHCIKKYLTRGD